MATEKLSATVEAELLAEVRSRVGPRGLSAFVARALRHELDRVALRDFLDSVADQVGPPDEVLIAEADVLLDSLTGTKSRTGRRRGSAA